MEENCQRFANAPFTFYARYASDKFSFVGRTQKKKKLFDWDQTEIKFYVNRQKICIQLHRKSFTIHLVHPYKEKSLFTMYFT